MSKKRKIIFSALMIILAAVHIAVWKRSDLDMQHGLVSRPLFGNAGIIFWMTVLMCVAGIAAAFGKKTVAVVFTALAAGMAAYRLVLFSAQGSIDIIALTGLIALLIYLMLNKGKKLFIILEGILFAVPAIGIVLSWVRIYIGIYPFITGDNILLHLMMLLAVLAYQPEQTETIKVSGKAKWLFAGLTVCFIALCLFDGHYVYASAISLFGIMYRAESAGLLLTAFDTAGGFLMRPAGLQTLVLSSSIASVAVGCLVICTVWVGIIKQKQKTGLILAGINGIIQLIVLLRYIIGLQNTNRYWPVILCQVIMLAASIFLLLFIWKREYGEIAKWVMVGCGVLSIAATVLFTMLRNRAGWQWSPDFFNVYRLFSYQPIQNNALHYYWPLSQALLFFLAAVGLFKAYTQEELTARKEQRQKIQAEKLANSPYAFLEQYKKHVKPVNYASSTEYLQEYQRTHKN